ncbi:MAG: nuclear transport factor 2 family protein [Kofleriaceae bacterium]|nr:nuclear transport factor 2 family protein [Kofleriaceae bacterium]
MSSELSPEVLEPPPRYLLRPAGLLTQLCSAGALLLGTIAFVLVQQNKSGGAALVIAWAAAAMAGLVFGGLMSRGGLIAVIGGAALDALFGIVLLVMDFDALRKLLRILPESDVHMIADILVVAAIVMLAVAVLSLAAIPQARTYAKALHEAEAEYAADEAANAMSFQAMRTVPPTAGMPPPAQPSLQPPPNAPAYVPPPHLAPPTRPSAPPGGYQPMPLPPTEAPGQPQRASFPAGALPLPPPAPTGPSKLYSPLTRASGPMSAPPPVGAAWDGGAPSPPATATNLGWQPNKARTTMMIVRPPTEERRSRRRMYIMLAGFAIGIGAGVGVIVASTGGSNVSDAVTETSKPTSGPAAKPATDNETAGAQPAVVVSDSSAGSDGSAGSGGTPAPAIPTPDVPVRTLLTAQRDLIAKVDATGLASLVASNGVAIGVDADDVAEGRAAVEEVIRKNLGEAPPDGFTVTSKFLAVGQEGNHAWTAEELDISGAGESRRITVTQLAAFVGGRWTVLAQQWARPVADATAERLAILGSLPSPKAIPSKAEGGDDLAKAVRAAFSSRAAFAAARSEREDGFNFGSAPGERVVGGAAIKRLFGRLKSTLKLRDGARVVGGAVWDPSQKDRSWIGFAAVNVDYTQKSRAATDLTQTFRVLAVLLREGEEWKIVQTQFSHAGPIN